MRNEEREGGGAGLALGLAVGSGSHSRVQLVNKALRQVLRTMMGVREVRFKYSAVGSSSTQPFIIS